MNGLGLVDEIVPEPLGGAHTDLLAAARNLKTVLCKQLDGLMTMSAPERLKHRYEKFRAFGHFKEKQAALVEAAS